MYIQWFIIILLLLFLIFTAEKSNSFENNEYYEYYEDNIDNREDDDDDNMEIYEKIKYILAQKRMSGGSVEKLAKNFLKNKENYGLKKILTKLKE